MRPIVTQPSSVVCLSVTLVSPAKTAAPIKMPFGLRTPVGPRNHVLHGGPDPQWEGAILRGKGASHCNVWGHYVVICAEQLNRLRCRMGCGLGWAIGIMGVLRCWGTLPWQPILGLKLLLTGFVWTIATRQLVMEGSLSGRLTECRYLPISCNYGMLPWQPFFGFLYVGWTLALPDEYDGNVHVRRRCGLMSNYFDHLLYFRPREYAAWHFT